MGSGYMSASCRPARVYSLRRIEASTVYLPAPRAWAALERTYDLGGDPTPVEVSLLRLDLLPPDPATVHPRWVEGDVASEARERRRRVRVVPGGTRFLPLLGHYVVVAGKPFPLAERAPGGRFQMLHPYVPWRDVVHGRVARLQDTFRPRGVGVRHAAEDDLDLLVHVLEPRRTRIVPYGLLSRTRFYSLATHKTSSSLPSQKYMHDECALVCAVSRHPGDGRLTIGSTGKEAMLIEVYSDVVCPWCYLGEKRLTKTLAERPDLEVRVRWRPFQLQPGMPEGGVPWAEFS